MSSLLDLVVPGAGTAAQALATILKLCQSMKESQDACSRVHCRLQEILTELAKMEERGQLPRQESLAKYAALVAQFLEYLQRYEGKTLFLRLIRHRKMMDELLEINNDVTMLFQMLQLATTATLMDWRRQWEIDRRNQERALAAMASNDAAALFELRGARAQAEALASLRFEMDRQTSRQSSEDMQLIQTLYKTILRTSKTRVQKLPPWYLPRDEVEFDSEPFAGGSYGSVHHGVWGAGTNVVVKCLLDGLDDRAQRQFEAEISIWYQFNHPHVLKMFGASHFSSPPVIVCENAALGSMCSYLTRSNENKRHMWRLLFQAALGLEHIHKKSVVHGDLKLNNILVGADGLAKISDFGLSIVRSSSSSSKAEGRTISGGLRWKAPECLRRRPTFASDVYSLAMCIIEAATDEPPFVFLDDDDVRANLRNGEIPEQPAELTDEQWKLVVLMTCWDPAERIPLAKVIERLKAFAEAEQDNQSLDATCRSCASAIAFESTRCLYCGALQSSNQLASQCVELTRSQSESDVNSRKMDGKLHQQGHAPDGATISILLDAMNSTDVKQQQNLLCMLSQKCFDSQQRDVIYRSNGVELLLSVVRGARVFRVRLYALLCLAWFYFLDAKIPQQEFEGVRNSFQNMTHRKLMALVDELRGGTAAEKEEWTIVCACFGSGIQCHRGGIIPLLAEIARTGTATQKFWATVSLKELANQSVANSTAIIDSEAVPALVELLSSSANAQKEKAAGTLCALSFKTGDHSAVIAQSGAIPPLVKLIQTGTHAQKVEAANALGNLAAACDENRMRLAQQGAVAPLVELVRSGSGVQLDRAVTALGNLAFENPANCVAIAHAGGIHPIVRLLKMGSNMQKERAATALGCLAIKNDSNRREIAREGAIPPLVELIQSGTEKQKLQAVFALGNLACQNDENCINLVRAGAIAPLIILARVGTNEQKTEAARTIGNVAAAVDVNRVQLAHEGAVEALLDLIRTGTATQKDRAACALGNIAYTNAETCKIIVDQGAVAILIDVIHSESSRVSQQAVAAVLYLTHIQAGIIAVKETPRAVPALVRLTKTGDDLQRKRALSILRNIGYSESSKSWMKHGMHQLLR